MDAANRISKDQVNILIVEDSPTQAAKLRFMIERAGYPVRLAVNGRQALAAIAERAPNLVLSDIVMPEMDGYALCRAIKSDACLHDVTVILITALTDPGDIVRGLECGADNFIRKPYSEGYLLARIEQALLNQQLRRHPKQDGRSGIMIVLDQQKYLINSKPQQILDLLISTYEQAVCGNEELRSRERQVKELNTRLTQRALELETSNQEMGALLHTLTLTQETLLRNEKMASLGALVAGVAHELNTPIGNSLMVATTLADKTRFLSAQYAGTQAVRRSELERYLGDAGIASDILQRNLTRAAELVTSFKQITVDQTGSRRRQFELKQMVAEIGAALSPAFNTRAFELVQAIPEDIVLDSFPGPLSQTVANLINNALIHGFDGRDHGRIRISALRRAEGWVDLVVADDGVGIPLNDLKHIYDPFFTTKLGLGGSGLGLNIIYNVITRVLGGQIDTKSEVGGGTVVTLSLPLLAPEPALPVPPRERQDVRDRMV
ncbi:signal transduction histidine kinase [Oxalobacteraceae bacterium GrIS 1.11]